MSAPSVKTPDPTSSVVQKSGTRVYAKPQHPDGSRPRRLLKNAGPPILIFALFITLWWLLSATIYGDQNYLLPRPLAVLQSMVDDRDLILGGLWITTKESAIGFGLAIVIGIICAVVMSLSKALERSFYPYAVLLQTVPIVAVAPVIVLWFGYNQNSVIVIAFIIALFPILNNTLLGLNSTDRNQLDLFEQAHRVPQPPVPERATRNVRGSAHLGRPVRDRRHRRRVHHRLGRRAGRPRREGDLLADADADEPAVRGGPRGDAAGLRVLHHRQLGGQPTHPVVARIRDEGRWLTRSVATDAAGQQGRRTRSTSTALVVRRLGVIS